MRLRYKTVFAIILSLLLFISYCNLKYEVVAFHPFRSEGQPELTVMTWNVHCSSGKDSIRQRQIAELIIDVDADIVLLNEYNLDCCLVMDSILKTKYPYTEEGLSRRVSGDIFYSKQMMTHSGRIKAPKKAKPIQAIKATIAAAKDSVQIFGVHMASNHYDGTTLEKEIESDTSSFERYKIAQEERCSQVHWIKMVLLESKHPVIVMGDMNDFNCSAPLDTLASCGLKDAWWEGGNGYGATFHDWWMRLRIDHILHSKELKLESIRVIEMNLSDHNPVVAGFSIKEN